MSSNDRQLPASPLVSTAPAAPPAPLSPEPLVDALRDLQQRIPGFTQLSAEEKRAHARAANLDPELIESGLHAAEAWHNTERLVNRTGEELRREQEQIRQWDQVVVELRALTDGIEAANLKRKHHLGSTILQIYRLLASQFERGVPHDPYMRPYYENMKQASLRTQRFRKRKKKEETERE